MSAIAHRLLEVPAGRIHVAEQGSGPLVLLVHGFPECWYSWRHQLPAIAAAGFHAVAIDARGYGRSSKPVALDAYRLLDLAEDIAGVIDGARRGRPRSWSATTGARASRRRPRCCGRSSFRAVGTAQRALRTAAAAPGPRDIFARIGGDGGVLRDLLPGAGTRGGRDRARRPRLARGLLRGAVRRHHAAPDGRSVSFVAQGGRLRDRFPDPGRCRPGCPRTTSTSTRASSSAPASPAR